MSATKLEFYRTAFGFGQWRWRIKSVGNHKIIAASSESFKNYGDCVYNAKLTRIALNDNLDTYLV